MRAVQVLPRQTDNAWPFVEQWVVTALSRGMADLTAADVRDHLGRGSMSLWLAWAGRPVGCCIVEIVESARGRACNLVVVAGGRLDKWIHLEADVARWARERGCVRLTLTGRRGWARRLVRVGWGETAVTMEKRTDGPE